MCGVGSESRKMSYDMSVAAPIGGTFLASVQVSIQKPSSPQKLSSPAMISVT
jgi:hypothetical protein